MLQWKEKSSEISISPDDAKIIKVASSSLSAKRFFKGENNTGHTIPVPDRPEDTVSKPAETSHNCSQLSSTHSTKRQLFMTTCINIFLFFCSWLEANFCLLCMIFTEAFLNHKPAETDVLHNWNDPKSTADRCFRVTLKKKNLSFVHTKNYNAQGEIPANFIPLHNILFYNHYLNKVSYNKW